jgi:tetratricopeptide (TPR) repeat protein
MDLALQALTDEQWQDGLAILDKLGPPTKHRSSYYYWVGYACSGCKLDDRAVKEYLKAVREDERNDSAILQLGLAYGRLGWIKKAERWLARGMELCPDDPHFDFAHGHMYAGNGYYEKAREWFQRASKRGGTGPIGARARSRIREINRKLGID